MIQIVPQFSGFNQNYYENHGTNIEDCGIVNPIHMDSINGKVQNSEYRSTVDFLNDIKWICHNITIMNGPGEWFSFSFVRNCNGKRKNSINQPIILFQRTKVVFALPKDWRSFVRRKSMTLKCVISAI